MASLNAPFAVDLEHSPTYLNLPENVRNEWLKKVRSFPPGWIQKPIDGQQFESHRDCLARLNAFGFFEGCLFVTGRQGGSQTPHWYFRCKFHGSKTENYRKLEARVVRNEEGEIVTGRKRDTHINKRECPVLYYLAHKVINRVTKERAYIGAWREEEHQNHPLNLNPFSFSIHEQSTDAFQLLAATACRFRSASQTYSKACQLLKEDGNGLILGQRTYYNLNLLRQKRPNKDDSSTITALLQGLKNDGFRFQTRLEEQYRPEDGEERLISRKLLQIFFYLPESAQMAQRFVAGHSLVLDGTFNTNQWRLPLLVAVGVTNEDRTFPIAFSFCPGENFESYNFFFDCLRAEIFTDGVLEPGVIIADQAAGLLSSIDTHGSIPRSKFQICNWHAVEAMMTRFRKAGKYTVVELDGPKNEQGEKSGPGLKDYCWDYVKSSTLIELQEKRQMVLNHLQPSEQAYIRDIWGPKEPRVVQYYIRLLPNLGAGSSQRVERYHANIKKVVQGQFSLACSTKKICDTATDLTIQLRTDEDKALMNRSVALDMNFFQHLVGTVSRKAIKLIETEWLVMTALLQQNQELGECAFCDILNRYSLPCRHYLRHAYEEGISIPRSLVHPRWWVKGPVIRDADWKPYYGEQTIIPQTSPPRRDLLSGFHRVLEQRERLDGEDRARFDRQIINSTNILNIAGQRKEQEAQLPIFNPDPIPKRQIRRVKSGQNARGMTANELAITADRRIERARIQTKNNAAILRAREENEQRERVSGIYGYRPLLIWATRYWLKQQQQRPLPTLRSLLP